MILKSLLEDATKAKDKLEHDYLQSHTERLILEAQLAALCGSGPIDEGYAAKDPSSSASALLCSIYYSLLLLFSGVSCFSLALALALASSSSYFFLNTRINLRS